MPDFPFVRRLPPPAPDISQPIPRKMAPIGLTDGIFVFRGRPPEQPLITQRRPRVANFAPGGRSQIIVIKLTPA